MPELFDLQTPLPKVDPDVLLAISLLVGALVGWLVGRGSNRWVGVASWVISTLTLALSGLWTGSLVSVGLVVAAYLWFKRVTPEVDPDPERRDRNSERIRQADGALRDAFDDSFERGHVRRPGDDSPE